MTREEQDRVCAKLDAMLAKLSAMQASIFAVRKAGEALDDELERIGESIDDLIVRGAAAKSR